MSEMAMYAPSGTASVLLAGHVGMEDTATAQTVVLFTDRTREVVIIFILVPHKHIRAIWRWTKRIHRRIRLHLMLEWIIEVDEEISAVEEFADIGHAQFDLALIVRTPQRIFLVLHLPIFCIHRYQNLYMPLETLYVIDMAAFVEREEVSSGDFLEADIALSLVLFLLLPTSLFDLLPLFLFQGLHQLHRLLLLRLLFWPRIASRSRSRLRSRSRPLSALWPRHLLFLSALPLPRLPST
jgi:hypothetical protein